MRDDWATSARVKFKSIAKKRNAKEYEKKIAEEMEYNTGKYFNKVRNLHANQQVLGMRETFREAFLKEWVSITHKIIDYSQHNK